jgi:hypothetical protein
MTDGADGPDPTRVDRIGPVGALVLYTSSAGLCLCGPVMLACTFFADAGLLLMGILFTVICIPVGLGLLGYTLFERESNRRLDEVGVVATAEITSLADWDDGESAGLAVGLRISGQGVRTFETTWKCSSDPALRVGLRFTAVVDPARRLFRLEF